MESKNMSGPKSLQEAIVFFSNPDNCTQYLAVRRWPNGVICPGCGSDRVSYNAARRTWKCSTHHSKREFSIKIGTIFADSALGLDKWLTAMWMLTNCKNGISSCEIGRALKVTQKTAWFMAHRIRLALQDESFGKMSGEVEVDETFIGGLSRNMHLDKRALRITGTGMKDKTPVVGILERGGKVRTSVIPNRRKKAVQAKVREHVTVGSILFTDSLPSYNDLESDYAHCVIDHAVAYVHGNVHTNGMENYWSLLKRGIKGT
jgi:transposase-like protein